MSPKAQENSEVGKSGVSSNREANIHGFTKGWDPTMYCKHSGTGNHCTYTRTISCSCSNIQYTYNIDDILLFGSLSLRVISLTRLPSSLVELSEPLQAIRYENGDFSNAHHDSSPSHSETTCAHTRLAGNTSALTEVSCRYVWKCKICLVYVLLVCIFLVFDSIAVV